MMRRALQPTGVAILLALLVAGVATAGDTPREIALTIETNRFSPAEITVSAETPFVLVITNKDKAAEEFESHALRIEKVIPAGKTVRVKVAGLKKGTYPFIGDFHARTAQGRIVAE